MNTCSDTPIYDQVLEDHLAIAFNTDDMDLLTALENMNSATAIQPSHANCDIPF